jgi:O-antigen/teichoic acid export membrane protein
LSGDAEARSLARGSAVSFLGAAGSAALGFALTIVLTRVLGDSGSGVVLQAIAIFSIALAVAKVGMDSTAVWITPRLVRRGAAHLRGTVFALAVFAAAGGALIGLLLLVLLPLLGVDAEVVEAVQAVWWGIPIAAVLMVALSSTRGLGGVGPYVGIGSIGLPALRLAAVVIATLLGAQAVAVTSAWAIPLIPALLAAVVVVVWQIRRRERRDGVIAPPLLLGRRRLGIVWGYAGPRTVSAGLEQALLWVDVVLVGTIAGAAAAGVYGGASRFVAAGLIVDSALRLVVSPRFSYLLGRRRIPDVQSLYRTAARWLVLFSTPIYLVLGIFAPVALSWLGPDFVRGELALAILCGGAIVTFAAGNIHSVLLMSGRSGWAAINKAIVLGLNVAGNLILVPLIGIEGAAISWAVAMLLDAILAIVQVRLFVGVVADLAGVGYAMLVTLLCVGVPAVTARLLLGPSLAGLLVAVGVGGTLLVVWCIRDRHRLHVNELIAMVRRRPTNGGD